MKCPKCGYTSFDYLDSCKKCHHALGEFKAKYGLRSLLFPHRTQPAAQPATPLPAAAAALAPAAAAVAESADFGYDFLADAPASPGPSTEPAPAAGAESFDFDADWDEAPAAAPQAAAPSAAGQAESAVDAFDFDADWDAPPDPAAAESRPPADPGLEEGADDAFDFLAEAPAPTAAETAGDGLDLDLGDLSAPLAAAVEETAFDFNDSWDEATPEDLPALAATPAAEPLPEFAAEPLDFGDTFDFADEDSPGPLSPEPKAPAAGSKPGAKEGPSDPFDQREPGGFGPAPAASPEADQDPAVPSPAPTGPPHAPTVTLGEGAGLPEPTAAEADRDLEAQPEGADELLPPPCDEQELAEQPVTQPLRPAGAPCFRLGAGTLDLLLLGLIYGLFLAAGKLTLFPADQAMTPLPPEALLDLAVPYFLILFSLCFGYFTLFHFLSGQTPGKMVFQLKVESASGQPLDLAQAFLRSVGGLVSLLCAGIGFLAILRGPDHQGWNDRLAGTRVTATGPSRIE